VTPFNLSEVLGQVREQGFARLGRLLDESSVVLLQERAEALMLGQVTVPGLFFQMDSESAEYKDVAPGQGWRGPSLAYRKLDKLEKDDRFRAWLSDARVEAVVRAMIAGPVVLYRAILFNKSAGGSSEIPWHQDGGTLWGLSENPTVQLWTALDDAPTGGGCLEVIPGSHHRGLVTARGGVVPPGVLHSARAEDRKLSLPAKAGEVILLHNHLWHRSGRSRLGQRRLAFSACYMSASTRCLRTKRAPRQFFEVFVH
jgi:phytanoyl-CoA hydroxylase